MSVGEQIGPDWRSQTFRSSQNRVCSQQAKRIDKLRTDPFFLISAGPMTSHSALFSYDVSGSTRTRYVIHLKRDGRFTCSCPDHRSHCQTHDVVCKHVIFLLFRVLKVVAWEFFGANTLTDRLFQEVERRSQVLVTFRYPEIRELASRIQNEQRELFTSDVSRQDIVYDFSVHKDVTDDDCPICYDSLSSKTCVGCPTCKNTLHKLCIEKWLQASRLQTCVCCRSPVWKHYTF